MMNTSLCMRTFPYLRMAVRAVTEMDSWTKPVMNHATQWTALFSPIIFITCEARHNSISPGMSACLQAKSSHKF